MPCNFEGFADKTTIASSSETATVHHPFIIAASARCHSITTGQKLFQGNLASWFGSAKIWVNYFQQSRCHHHSIEAS